MSLVTALAAAILLLVAAEPAFSRCLHRITVSSSVSREFRVILPQPIILSPQYREFTAALNLPCSRLATQVNPMGNQ
jgi:hypothetical protein